MVAIGKDEGRQEGSQGCEQKIGTEKRDKAGRRTPLTFFVAANISTRRCLTRLSVRAGIDESLAVNVPISSFHVVPDEKKLKGKNFSTIIRVAKSSRVLKRKYKGGKVGGVASFRLPPVGNVGRWKVENR